MAFIFPCFAHADGSAEEMNLTEQFHIKELIQLTNIWRH